ncbi:MAG: thiamine diphosphokinase [Ruminococcus sp.]|nr:thiamine diphosphokinase [Ruminococcus sp.]
MRVCHIFAGGEISDTSFIRINDGEKIICADGGLRYVQELGLNPDIVVGDFDSYKGELPESSVIMRSVPEKDDTDTLLAVKAAISDGAEQIRIYGALGGRFDHTFANVQTLKYAAEHGCRASLEDSDNIVMLQEKGERRYNRLDGWYFAFFAYSEQLKVKRLSGVKYPLEEAVIRNNFPIGVSNEFSEPEALLDIEEGTALIVLSKK